MNKGLVEIVFTQDYGNNKKGDSLVVTKGFGNELVKIHKVAKFPAPKKAAPKKETK